MEKSTERKRRSRKAESIISVVDIRQREVMRENGVSGTILILEKERRVVKKDGEYSDKQVR